MNSAVLFAKFQSPMRHFCFEHELQPYRIYLTPRTNLRHRLPLRDRYPDKQCDQILSAISLRILAGTMIFQVDAPYRRHRHRRTDRCRDQSVRLDEAPSQSQLPGMQAQYTSFRTQQRRNRYSVHQGLSSNRLIGESHSDSSHSFKYFPVHNKKSPSFDIQ